MNARTRRGRETVGPSEARLSLRERKKTQARELILESAQTLIRSGSYSETKMRDVAAASRVSYQTLYNYFPTKGLILQELLTRDLPKRLDPPAESPQTAASQSQDSIETKLAELAQTYINAIAPAEKELWREVCAEALRQPSPRPDLLDILDNRASERFVSALEHAINAGQLKPHIDTATMSKVFAKLLNASLMQYLANDNSDSRQTLAAVLVELQFCLSHYLRDPGS